MSWQHMRDERPTARKAHRCFLCEREIAVGEVHRHRTGIGDGGFDAFRMHEACAVHAAEIYEYEWGGHDVDEFRESLEKSLMEKS